MVTKTKSKGGFVSINSSWLRGVSILLACVVWYLLSGFHAILEKKIVGRFPFPITITLIGFISNALFSIPLVFCLRLRNSCVSFSWKLFFIFLLPLCACKVFSVVCSHLAILLNSVSFSQTVKASTPIFTVVLCRVLLKEKQTFGVYLSLVPIAVGVGIATVTEISCNYLGLLASIVGTIAFSIENIFKKKVIEEMEVHPFELLGILSRWAVPLFLPIWTAVDFHHLDDIFKLLTTPSINLNHTFSSQNNHHHSSHHHHGNGSTQIVDWPLLNQLCSLPLPYLLFLVGIIHFFISLLSYKILSLLCKLSFAVASATDRLFIIVISLIFLRNPVTLWNISGMSFAISGVFLYSYLHAKASARQKEKERINRDIERNVSMVTIIALPPQSNNNNGDDRNINTDPRNWNWKTNSGFSRPLSLKMGDSKYDADLKY